MEATNSNTYRDRPSVKVFFDEAAVDVNSLKSILHGIEEEGIPYDVVGKTGMDLYELSHEASLNSRLGVGIGVTKSEIALQYEKLEKMHPIFVIKSFKKENHRIIGANAARLVKKMPFKYFY